MKSGIYAIINQVNGKIYYGSSINLERRFSRHKYFLNKNKHPNSHLQNAWNKYGENVFSFEILEELQREKLLTIEQQYLDLTKQIPELYYNISNHSTAPMTGRKSSEETRKRLSFAKKGKKHPMFGKKHSNVIK